jgi:Holliday junction resolvase RusA-like endonuclease
MAPKRKQIAATKYSPEKKQSKHIAKEDNYSFHCINSPKVDMNEHTKSFTCKINGIPRPQYRCVPLKSGRMVNVFSAYTKSFSKAYSKALQEANQTIFSMSGNPVKITVRFYFPRPLKHFQKQQINLPVLPNAPVYFTNMPDVDNVQKLLLDALENICYKNDKDVAHIEATKLYDPEHRFWKKGYQPTGITIIKVQEIVEDKYEKGCCCESCKYKRKYTSK